MNIDDAGSFNTKDKSRYYILSGVIVNESDYKPIKTKVHQFKLDNFHQDYIDSEIHVHDIYKGKMSFSSLKLEQKYSILENLYNLISNLPITVISVVIDKLWFEIFYSNWNIFNTAWSILFQRFDYYLEREFNGEHHGRIRIDKSTKDQHRKIERIVNSLQNDLVEAKKIKNIIGKPFFVNSESSELIQVADAVGYCTLKHLTGTKKFKNFWDSTEPKYYNNKGQIDAYGLIIFPKEENLLN